MLAVKPCWNPLVNTFCSSLGSTLLLIERTMIDPLYLWVISSLVLGLFWRGNYIGEVQRKAEKGVPRRPLGTVDIWAVPGPHLAAVSPILDKVEVLVNQPKISRNFCHQDFLIWHHLQVGSGTSLKSIWWRQIQGSTFGLLLRSCQFSYTSKCKTRTLCTFATINRLVQ